MADHYLPAIEGREPADLYLIQLDDRPIGFIESYAVSDYPDYAQLAGVGEGVVGGDLFIADAGLIGRELGTAVLRTFVDGVVFRRSGTIACVAAPSVDNLSSLRAFEKAGFLPVREFVDPEEGLVRLLRRGRA